MLLFVFSVFVLFGFFVASLNNFQTARRTRKLSWGVLNLQTATSYLRILSTGFAHYHVQPVEYLLV
ncbi:MAG: hypothetical protein OXI96_01315 [Acidimicrobiaceae bacterium]|nr:hypothetical protein [Acidimicrobiaceae bacterium]